MHEKIVRWKAKSEYIRIIYNFVYIFHEAGLAFDYEMWCKSKYFICYRSAFSKHRNTYISGHSGLVYVDIVISFLLLQSLGYREAWDWGTEDYIYIDMRTHNHICSGVNDSKYIYRIIRGKNVKIDQCGLYRPTVYNSNGQKVLLTLNS